MATKTDALNALGRLELRLDALDAEMLKLSAVADEASLAFCEVRDLIDDLEDPEE